MPARAGEWGARWLDTIRRLLGFAGLYVALYVVLQPLLLRAAPGSRAGAFGGSVLTLVAALVAGVVMIRSHARPAGALGIGWTRGTGAEIARGLLIGLLAIAAAVVVMLASGGLRYAPDAGGLVGWLRVLAVDFGFLAVAATAEEVTFRGYPFQLIAKVFGPAVAAVVTSAAFTLAHAGNPNTSALAFVNIFLAGLLLALAYLRTRSLWFAAAVHLGWNWAVAVVADLPVSGLEFTDTPLYEPVVGGPAWLTGGAFGPEGGMAATFAALLGLVVIVRWRRVAETAGMRALRPLIDGEEPGERVVRP